MTPADAEAITTLLLVLMISVNLGNALLMLLIAITSRRG